MVHTLAWSPSGRLLAAGLGDGTVGVYSIENRSCVEVARLQEENDRDSSVASVLFPALSATTSSSSSSHHATSQDRLLACIRNDAVIKLWDLGSTVAGEKAVKPVFDCLGQDSADSASTSMELENAVDELSLVDKPNMIFSIPHHRKPNWMVSTVLEDPDFPASIFVGDISNEITAYSIPTR